MLTPEDYMQQAMQLAARAAELGEVPVGAVVVCNGEVIGEGYNQPISGNDPTAHAEIIAIRNAAQKLRNYRLVDCDLYVTIEPCSMCVGAITHARIKKLWFGADEPKSGAVKSGIQLLNAEHLNRQIEWQGGVLAEQCRAQISAFFEMRRKEKKKEKLDKR